MGRLTHKNSKRNATFVQIVQSWDYQYDAMNNIKSRIDNVNFQRENFEYDNLNRLLEVHHGYLNHQLLGLVQSMNYDNLGNITFKTDVGNMQYSPTHPFQMEMLTENPQTITSEHVLEYFVSGRTKTIEDNDKKLQFTYGSDLQRRKMEYFLEDQLQSTTLYPFGNYEEVHNAATNDVLKYNYIGSPDGLIAIRKTINGTSQLYYTLTDHLGSIDALCDENGSVVERYSYDACSVKLGFCEQSETKAIVELIPSSEANREGNRRNPSDWSEADTRTTWITTRGFTGHEHLDKFGLINANARMYEPLTGKFLAPDPYVQAPDYSQSFNRYAYCWNNPLKYSDPSGEIIGTLVTLGIDLASTIFTKGGLEFWNWNGGDSYVGRAWENFDPSAKWSKTNKAAKIDLGLLNTDPNKNPWERAWELTSRFTWQLPQTVAGNFIGHYFNNRNNVNWVDYYGGATIINVNDLGFGARGAAHGNYIFGEGISANPFEIDPNFGRPSDGAMLLRHEYGHYIQSQVSGPLYYGKYGIPSANGNALTWTEVDAEYRSDQYFIKHYGTGLYGPRQGPHVRPSEFLFITRDPDRYLANYRPVNPRWWEYTMFFYSGFICGTLLLGFVFN